MRYKAYFTDPDSWYIKPGQLGEAELDRVLITARRWADLTGRPLVIKPTRVIYGRP